MRDFIVTPPVETDEEAEYIIVMPTHKKVAIQARQSRKRQAMYNKESYEYQTKVMYQRAIKLGWSDDDITMLIENKRKNRKGEYVLVDASGTKRIDQRPTMQDLWGYIGSDEYGAVMTRAVDRLFRHINMIEPAQFAEHCKKHHVIILTEHQRFDFNKRPEDTKRFLAEAQKGADYITEHIAMMGRYRHEKSLRGEWDGRNIPVGFVLDEERLHYVICEEHAAVVRWIFRRYRELGGSFSELYKEIAALPYLFPYVAGVKLSRMTRGERGYTITPRGLRDLLCNTAYIGWWLVYDYAYKTVDLEDGSTQRVLDKKTLRAKIERNHPAMVDDLDFWYAYDTLNPEQQEGERHTRERFSKIGTIAAGALLEGIVTSLNGNRVYVNQMAEGPEHAIYEIVAPTEHALYTRKGAIYVKTVDTLFTDLLLAKLEEGKRLRNLFKQVGLENDADFLEHLMVIKFMNAAQAAQQSTKEFDTKLKGYREEAASLEHTLHYGAAKLPPETVVKFSEDLAKLHVSIGQLELKKKRAQVAAAELTKFAEKLDDIPAVWKEMRVSMQQRFIKLVVESITLSKPSPNWMLLDITWAYFNEWDESPRSLFYIWQKKGRGQSWNEEEKAILRQLYPYADRASILAALPRRNWYAIITQSTRMGVSRFCYSDEKGIPHTLSLDDAAFMRRVGLTFETADQVVWYKESIDRNESSSKAIL